VQLAAGANSGKRLAGASPMGGAHLHNPRPRPAQKFPDCAMHGCEAARRVSAPWQTGGGGRKGWQTGHLARHAMRSGACSGYPGVCCLRRDALADSSSSTPSPSERVLPPWLLLEATQRLDFDCKPLIRRHVSASDAEGEVWADLRVPTPRPDAGRRPQAGAGAPGGNDRSGGHHWECVDF
jgi:hypothetical protein